MQCTVDSDILIGFQCNTAVIGVHCCANRNRPIFSSSANAAICIDSTINLNCSSFLSVQAGIASRGNSSVCSNIVTSIQRNIGFSTLDSCCTSNQHALIGNAVTSGQCNITLRLKHCFIGRGASIRNLLVRLQNAQIACSFICRSNGNILSRLQLNIAVNISIRGNNVDVASVIVNLEVSAIVVRQRVFFRAKVKVQIVHAHNKVESLAQARDGNIFDDVMLIVQNDITSNSRNIHLPYFNIISRFIGCLLDIASIGLRGKLIGLYLTADSDIVCRSNLSIASANVQSASYSSNAICSIGLTTYTYAALTVHHESITCFSTSINSAKYQGAVALSLQISTVLSININHAAAVLDAQAIASSTYAATSLKRKLVASVNVADTASFAACCSFQLIAATKDIARCFNADILRCQAAKNHVLIQLSSCYQASAANFS